MLTESERQSCLFASHVSKVVLADRDETVGSQVAALLRDKGFEAEFVACDVSNEAAVNAMMGVAQGIGGEKIDTLVNVA